MQIAEQPNQIGRIDNYTNTIIKAKSSSLLVKVAEMADEVLLEYDYCDIVLGRIRHLNSEEKEQIHLWFGKQLDVIGMRQPHAIVYSRDLESEILQRGTFEGYWENVNEAKKFVTKLLRYVKKFEPVPIVSHRVIQPEFPPVYQIAKMKSMGYLDEEIMEKAKTWGFEEIKVREIIKDHINVQASFDMKAFCSEVKKTQKKL